MTSMGVKNPQEYGYEVYKRVLVKMDGQQQQQKTNTLFQSSFIDKKDGEACYNLVMKRIDKSIESATEVDFIALPPLFFYSCKDEISVITDQLIIVFCANGPVIPVVFSKNNRTLHGNEQLPNHIMTLYDATCSDFVSVDNLKQVLNKS